MVGLLIYCQRIHQLNSGPARVLPVHLITPWQAHVLLVSASYNPTAGPLVLYCQCIL